MRVCVCALLAAASLVNFSHSLQLELIKLPPSDGTWSLSFGEPDLGLTTARGLPWHRHLSLGIWGCLWSWYPASPPQGRMSLWGLLSLQDWWLRDVPSGVLNAVPSPVCRAAASCAGAGPSFAVRVALCTCPFCPHAVKGFSLMRHINP